MITLLLLTGTGILLTLLALVGLATLRGPAQFCFTTGMLCLALTWFIPAILSLLLQRFGLEALPWPGSAIVNVILYTVGGALLLLAALARGAADRRGR